MHFKLSLAILFDSDEKRKRFILISKAKVKIVFSLYQ